MIPRKNTSLPTRGSDNIPFLGINYNFSQNSYFPPAIKEWNRLDIDIRKSDSISIFKKRVLSFIKPLPNKVSSSRNSQGLKLLTRLRLGLSHLRYSSILFWMPLILSVAVALMSKQRLIFFSTAQTLWNIETPFWEKFLKLIASL